MSSDPAGGAAAPDLRLLIGSVWPQVAAPGGSAFLKFFKEQGKLVSETARTSYTFANGTLTVMDGTRTEAALKFSGSYTQSEFVLGSDGHGGTLITPT